MSGLELQMLIILVVFGIGTIAVFIYIFHLIAKRALEREDKRIGEVKRKAYEHKMKRGGQIKSDKSNEESTLTQNEKEMSKIEVEVKDSDGKVPFSQIKDGKYFLYNDRVYRKFKNGSSDAYRIDDDKEFTILSYTRVESVNLKKMVFEKNPIEEEPIVDDSKSSYTKEDHLLNLASKVRSWEIERDFPGKGSESWHRFVDNLRNKYTVDKIIVL